MSILSNFGFTTETEEEFDELLDLAFESGKSIKTAHGNYLCYYDPSGCELWIQGNKEYDILNMAPKFSGQGIREICLVGVIEQEDNPMDAHYQAWAEPENEEDPESGIYPFLFNVPDYRLRAPDDLPKNGKGKGKKKLLLTAAPFQATYYRDAEEFKNDHSQSDGWGPSSFVPIGLFQDEETQVTAQPTAMISGTVEQSKRLSNNLTGQDYFWMLIHTLGGPVDVVAHPAHFDSLPAAGGILSGEFWLSGKML